MRFPVATSETSAWSLSVETSHSPSADSTSLPPVWIGSYVLAALKLRVA